MNLNLSFEHRHYAHVETNSEKSKAGLTKSIFDFSFAVNNPSDQSGMLEVSQNFCGA